MGDDNVKVVEKPSDDANVNNGDAPKQKQQETSCSNEKKDDGYSIKMKPQYILSSRPSCLPDLPSAPPESATRNNDNSSSKSRKKTGMNKKRPRDARIPDEEKMCNSVIRGESCTFTNCKYNHDLKKALSDRPTDIKEVEGGCPHWNNQGYCIYGIMCRVGSCHLNMSDGTNLKREIEGDPSPSTKNVVDKDVLFQLRKRRYPFVCKSHREKQQQQQQLSKQEMISKDDLDLSPLPSKPRKLIDFRNKVYIAPLTTVGNLPFRRIMKRFGADITCGEMALAQNLLQGQTSEWALLKRHPEEDVFGVQIAAGYPEMYTRIAEVLEAHTEVDFVDCNLGCPIDLICDKYGAGAKMMLRDNRLKTSLEGMTNVLSCPVTVKIRTGWDENKPIAEALVKKIHGWGIEGIGAIMIHGRSRLQRYQKLANWDYIHTVASAQSSCSDKDHPVIPVIGNGDIFSYTDYHDKLSLNSSSNANEHGDNNSSNDTTTTTSTTSALSPTAMLGRGALIKPWLPTEIKEKRHWDISSSERLDMLKQFVKFGLEHWGSDQKGVNTTRRFLLEWLSFLYRYVPVGLLEVLPQQMNMRPPQHTCGRDDLETLMLSKHCADWIKISEMLLGPVPDDFQFQPKHKANGY